MDGFQLEKARLEAQDKRAVALFMFLRTITLLVYASLILFFGLVPFLLGVFTQAVSFRRNPPLLNGLMAIIFFGCCSLIRWGSPLTLGHFGDSWTSITVALVFFIAFFSSGSTFFRGWRYRRFSEPPGWFMFEARQAWARDQAIRNVEAEGKWKEEIRSAVFENVGFHPFNDIDTAAIVARGGDSYGHFMLFKCPTCGHPVLHDYEHDVFYPDLTKLDRDIALSSIGASTPCPACGYLFVSDRIWEMAREPASYKDWLIILPEIHRVRLDWILRPEAAKHL